MFQWQQPDGVRRDKKSDALAGPGLDGVRRVDGEKFGGRAADDHALPVADETDAVDRPRQRRATGLDDADGFGADHGDRGWQVHVAADRLPPARQYQLAVLERRFDDVRGPNEFGDEAIL